MLCSHGLTFPSLFFSPTDPFYFLFPNSPYSTPVFMCVLTWLRVQPRLHMCGRICNSHLLNLPCFALPGTYSPIHFPANDVILHIRVNLYGASLLPSFTLSSDGTHPGWSHCLAVVKNATVSVSGQHLSIMLAWALLGLAEVAQLYHFIILVLVLGKPLNEFSPFSY